MYNYCIYLYLYSPKKNQYFSFKYLWRMAHNFCGAPISVAHAAWCATECTNVTPGHTFLWRTQHGAPQKVGLSVAHPGRAPQKYIFVARFLWRTQQAQGCATET